MVDNTDNWSGNAPINGKYNGPVWKNSGSFENYMKRLRSGNVTGKAVETGKPPLQRNSSANSSDYSNLSQVESYWLPQLAVEGKQPIAPNAGYKFYRDVTDYGADSSGSKDATEAINAAVQDGDRCGMECGNSCSPHAIGNSPDTHHLSPQYAPFWMKPEAFTCHETISQHCAKA